MEHYTEEETDSAKKLLDFYIDLVENHNSTIKFYLAENVVLDWFGKTIKDNKKVALFIKDQVSKVTHHITNTFPSDNVAFKESHHVKVPKHENMFTIPPISPPNKNMETPPKETEPSTSMLEIGQGDGVHNGRPPTTSPPKKMRLGSGDEDTEETVECEVEASPLRYATAEGCVEFHRPSYKKFQTETKWKRPVKLHLGYTSSSFKDCTIYLIIYEGNLKCRRNLLKEFCESENST